MAVLGFFVLTPVLVRSSSNSAAVLIVSYCILLVVLIAIGLYLTFKRGDIVVDMPVGKQLKTEKRRRIGELVFRGIALVMAVTAMLMFGNISKPLLSYSLGWMPAGTET
jgi:hypothetical protein